MQPLSYLTREQLADELLAAPAPDITVPGTAPLHAGPLGTLTTEQRRLQRKLALAREILLRDLAAPLKRRNLLQSPDAVREWLTLRYCQTEQEIFTVLYLDVKLRLIGADDLFAGSLTHTSVYPREVVKQALSHNAASVVVAHNHPSGDCVPSPADQLLTRVLAQALALVDICLRDHFVIGCDQVYSFAEHGLL